MTQLRVKFPGVLAVTTTGLFLLTATAPNGDAKAQVFFLQGEKGDQGEPGDSVLECAGGTCTLAQNLTVTGDIDVSGTGVYNEIEVETLIVDTSYWLPECPQGYLRNAGVSDFVVCEKDLGNGKKDEMVKVGDFWIDRYEMSVWAFASCDTQQYGWLSDGYPAGFPDNGNWTASVYACSMAESRPSRYMTWFQAQQACRSSGKRLCTDSEWQAAASGTPDPHTSDPGDDSELCNIWENSKPVESTWAATNVTILAGTASQCVSNYGAYDFIGNVWEWTSDWWGQGEDGSAGSQSSDVYGNDGYFNVDPAETTGDSAYLPAASARGGGWLDGSQSGVFSIDMRHSPSYSDSNTGARCCTSK